MTNRFLDTNVLLRLLVQDHPEMSAAAQSLMQRVEDGDETVVTTPFVIFETAFTLQRTYRLPKARIRDLLQALVSLPNIQMDQKEICLRALDLSADHNIPFADAYNAAWMLARGVVEIYTWDRDFNRIPGITRIEPDTTAT